MLCSSGIRLGTMRKHTEQYGKAYSEPVLEADFVYPDQILSSSDRQDDHQHVELTPELSAQTKSMETYSAKKDCQSSKSTSDQEYCDEESTFKCEICELIKKNYSGDWIYSWFFDLLEWEDSGYDLSKDRTVFDRAHCFRLRAAAEKVKKIRSKLRDIRTKLPAWNILDEINSCVTDSSFEKEKILDYVKTHVKIMLNVLYAKLWDEDENLERYPPTISNQNESNQNKMRDLLRRLYSRSSRKLMFGPLGERPLHLCSLSVSRFEDTRVKKGITDGMRDFMEDNRERKRKLNEIYVSYGKDYCAMIGWLLWGEENPGDDDHDLEVYKELPFYEILLSWKSLYHKSFEREKGNTNKSCWKYPSKGFGEDKRILVTVGLYEGENILFPLIASGDFETVKWLLDYETNYVEKEDDEKHDVEKVHVLDERLVDQKAIGLFFRPRLRRWLASSSYIEGWAMYRQWTGENENIHAGASYSYFGLEILPFSASQGHVKIANWIFNVVLDNLMRRLKKIEISNDTSNGELNKPSEDSTVRKFARLELLNKRDEYGNSMLHLAAWNGKRDMYDWLVRQKADPRAINGVGLTPLTLTVRFGIWDMFDHIRTKHLATVGWKFGNVIMELDDISQVAWRRTGPFASELAIERCQEHLALRAFVLSQTLPVDSELEGKDIHAELKDSKLETFFKTLSESDVKAIKFAVSLGEQVHAKAKTLDSIRRLHNQQSIIAKSNTQGQKSRNFRLWGEYDAFICKYMDVVKELSFRDSGDFLSAVTIIALFRPKGWFEATKDSVEPIVLKKWNKVYGLVHLGNSIIPYVAILVLFCIMWQWRRLNILDHSMWWSDSRVYAPRTDPSVEATCGWTAIRDSVSGRIQAALIIYGVPSLLRSAYVQRRVRPTDLDENEDMTFSVEELQQFAYVNLESLLHISISGLFVAIGATRVLAGPDCQSTHLVVEKNTTAIAGLLLFVNLLLVARPVKIVGQLVLTLYRFLVKDVFRFLIVYSAFFVAFLIALQTLNNSNDNFLAWMENDEDTLLPKMNMIQDDLLQTRRLKYLDFDMEGCKSERRSVYDTASTLLSISLGDGFGDALKQASTYQFRCGGFDPDVLTAIFLIVWVFFTNILQLNMLIAMMSNTFKSVDNEVDHNWLLDLSYRIMRYQRMFPELSLRAHKPIHNRSIWNIKYWFDRLMDIGIIFYCIPEVHMWGFPLRICLRLKHRLWPKLWVKDGRGLSCKNSLEEEWKDIMDDIVDGLEKEYKIHTSSSWLARLGWTYLGKVCCKANVNDDIVGGAFDEHHAHGGDDSSRAGGTANWVVRDHLARSARQILRRRKYVKHIELQGLKLVEDNKMNWKKLLKSQDDNKKLKMQLLLLAHLVGRVDSLKSSFNNSMLKQHIRIIKLQSTSKQDSEEAATNTHKELELPRDHALDDDKQIQMLESSMEMTRGKLEQSMQELKKTMTVLQAVKNRRGGGE